MLNKRAFLIIILLIIAIGALSSVSANDSADDSGTNVSICEVKIDDNCDELGVDENVDEIADTNADILSVDGGTFSELQNKINRAAEGSTVYLYNDYTYNNDLNGIKITKSLTIEGNGHTINGLSSSMLLHIEGADEVILNNIVFKNGLNGEYGGAALYSKQSDITINSCVFDFNIALNGGGIYALNSYITANECYFENCGVLGAGGAVCSIYSYLIFSNTHFNSNFGQVAGGDVFSHGGIMSFSDSSFSNSYTGGMGGSISSEEDSLTFTRCQFYNCSSYLDGGGAVYSLNSNFESYSSQFEKCYSLFGGAICCLNTDVKIKNNRFYNNTAAIYGGSVYTIYGSLSLEDSIFAHSYGMMYGGAMYVRSPHIIHNIKNNQFLYSHAIVGPRIYVDSYYGDIPETGNTYEDVVFLVANFRASNTTEEANSEVITYVISNSNDYQNDLSYYENLKDEFISKNGIVVGPSEHFNVNIYDEEFPHDSIIFLNSNDFSNHTIAYNLTNSINLDYRVLSINFYDVGGMEVNYLNVLSLVGAVNENLRLNCEYSNLYVSNRDQNGWWTRPIFEDESRIMALNTSDHWACPLNASEFMFNEISGRFIFNFEDRAVASNYGNVYDLQSMDSTVPLINSEKFIDYLPSYYDSRDYGYTTPVQDQSTGGNCWAFAGIATLEACIKKITGQTYDFSEDNAKNLMAISSIYGLNLQTNKGGYDTMFMGYLTSWLGPIDNHLDPYNPMSSLSQAFYSQFHIQDITFLPTRQNSNDNDEYKKAIINCGAICVIFDYGVEEYHAVSLVGWDDSYVGKDSLGNNAHGVWIFKNSWGSEWGDNGFGYLSYEQPLSGQITEAMHAYTFVFSDEDDAYQDIYQYDFAGLTNYLDIDGNYVYYKNKFTSKEEEFLCAFSTYFESETDFTFSVRINGADIVTTNDGEPIETPIHHASPGYHTISLGYTLALNPGDEFEIIVKLLNPEENKIPVCQADDLYKLSYPSGVSFISYNGVDWIDLYDLKDYNMFEYTGTVANTCQVACIKAFTNYWRYNSDESPYIEVANADLIESDDGSVLSRNYDIYQIESYIFREYGIIAILINDWDEDNNGIHCNNLIKICVNDEVYYENVTSKIVYFPFDFSKEGYYRFSAILQSNHYTSNLDKLNFVGGEDTSFSTFTELMEKIDEAEEGETIYLDSNYYLDDEFYDQYYYVLINKSLTIDGNGHIINGLSRSTIFGIDSGCTVVLQNIQFVNGNSTTEENAGGAIFSYGNLEIHNCIFINNGAFWGGAIYSSGECYIEESLFEDNFAYCGGAIFSEGDLYVVNSNFDSNNADFGGAIGSNEVTIVHSSEFKDNVAGSSGGAIYSEKYCDVDQSVFDSNSANYGGAIGSVEESTLNINGTSFTNNKAAKKGGTIYSINELTLTNSNLKSNDNGEMVYFSYYYDNEGNAYGDLNLNNNKMQSNAPSVYYDGGEIPYKSLLYLVFSNVKVVKGEYVGICQVKDENGNTFYVKDVNIVLTNKNDASKVIHLKIEFNNARGIFGLDTSSLDYGAYQLTGSISSDYATTVSVVPGTLQVVEKYIITASDLIKEYGNHNKLIVTLRDNNGNAVANTYVDINVNGNIIKVKTDANGQAVLDVNLAPNTYLVKVSYAEGGNSASAIAKVTIVKATLKLTAKKKTFKAKIKIKKYTITLKDNLGKVMKKAKVTLKIKGKIYNATTNTKGKATFKIKNLKKKGKYKATVKFAGNAYYKGVSKKVVITVKK